MNFKVLNLLKRAKSSCGVTNLVKLKISNRFCCLLYVFYFFECISVEQQDGFFETEFSNSEAWCQECIYSGCCLYHLFCFDIHFIFL